MDTQYVLSCIDAHVGKKDCNHVKMMCKGAKCYDQTLHLHQIYTADQHVTKDCLLPLSVLVI